MAVLKQTKVKSKRTKTGAPRRRRAAVAELSMREAIFGSVEPSEIRARIINRDIRARTLTEYSVKVLGITLEELAAAMDISPRTLNRRNQSSDTLEIGESDRAYRIARIVDLATQMIGDRRRAVRWMHDPTVALGGEAPLKMIRTEIGTQAVEQSLYAIGYGGIA